MTVLTLLQELFYNTAVPLESWPQNQDEFYKKIARILKQADCELNASLDENQLKLFKEYKETTSRMDELLAVDYFEQGFRVGVKLMRETFDPLKERHQCK